MHTCMHTQTHKVSSRDNPAGPHPTTKSMQCFLLGLPIFPGKVQVDTSSDEPSQPVSRLEPGIAKWDTQVTPSELAWLIPRYYLHRNIWSRKTSEVSTVAKCKRGSKASHSSTLLSFHIFPRSDFEWFFSGFGCAFLRGHWLVLVSCCFLCSLFAFVENPQFGEDIFFF